MKMYVQKGPILPGGGSQAENNQKRKRGSGNVTKTKEVSLVVVELRLKRRGEISGSLKEPNKYGKDESRKG